MSTPADDYHPDAMPLPDVTDGSAGAQGTRTDAGHRLDPEQVERLSVSPGGDPPESRAEEAGQAPAEDEGLTPTEETGPAPEADGGLVPTEEGRLVDRPEGGAAAG